MTTTHMGHGSGLAAHTVAGEPLRVWIGAGGRGELADTLRAWTATPRPGRSTVVIHPPNGMNPADLLETIADLAATTDRVVVTGDGVDPHVVDTFGNLHLVPVPVVVERDAERAVIGTLQMLGRDEDMAVIWPAADAPHDVEGLIARGVAWRAAWDPADELGFEGRPSAEVQP